jgi:hypothetical protein
MHKAGMRRKADRISDALIKRVTFRPGFVVDITDIHGGHSAHGGHYFTRATPGTITGSAWTDSAALTEQPTIAATLKQQQYT